MKLRLILFIFILLFVRNSFAQSIEQIYKGFHLSLNLSNIYTRFYHENIVDQVNFITKYTPGYLVGTNIMYNLNQSFGIETSINYIRCNFKYIIKPEFSNVFHVNIISLPLNLEYHLQVSKLVLFAVNGGISYNLYENWGYFTMVNNPTINILDVSGNYQEAYCYWMTSVKNHFSYDFAFYFIYTLKNNCMIKLGPVFRYSKNIKAIFEYASEHPPYQIDGVLNANTTYFGINIALVFTNIFKK